MKIPRWTFTTLVTIAILWLTLAPDPLPSDMHLLTFPGMDKVVHAVMMAGWVSAISLDMMIYRSRRGQFRHLRLVTLLFIAVIITALGGMIELAQKAMDMGRGAELADFGADAIGAFFAAIIWRVIPLPWSPHQ